MARKDKSKCSPKKIAGSEAVLEPMSLKEFRAMIKEWSARTEVTERFVWIDVNGILWPHRIVS